MKHWVWNTECGFITIDDGGPISEEMWVSLAFMESIAYKVRLEHISLLSNYLLRTSSCAPGNVLGSECQQ